MRKLLLALVCLAGVHTTNAQCNEFFQFKQGSTWELESYNAKGKLEGTTKQSVTIYSEQSDSFVAKIHSTLFDKKGNEVTQNDLDFRCEGGTMVIDMRNFVNEEQMKAFQSYELTMESENLEIPGTLTVGQALKDGQMTLTASDAPIPMTMTVTITDRKVVGKESITTPAGTFECYKITSNSTVKTKMGVGMTFEFATVEWLAPKVAVVKSESYRKGKLQGYTLLTSWKN